MKRCLYSLILFAMLLVISGCKREMPNYEEPVFTPGILESDQLKVEKGNFDRANKTGSGRFLEIETGYYYTNLGWLLYAEKTDMNSWYYVCSNPNCTHGVAGGTKICSAQAGAGDAAWDNGRLYTVVDIELFPHLKPSSKARGLALLSMEKSGNNMELAYFCEDQRLSGGGITRSCLFPDTSCLLDVISFNPDGSYTERLIFTDRDRQEWTLLEKHYAEQPMLCLDAPGHNYNFYGINGDISFTVLNRNTDDRKDYIESFCWIQDGEMVATDLTGIPGKYGYLNDGTLRGFGENDGYYDTNLITGEQIRLADAQLSDSGARILQPNCIIESTLFYPENTLENQRMRFFDGQNWHEVALPEELQNTADPTFEVVALTSDRLIFRTVYNTDGRDYVLSSSIVTLYEMPLEGDYSLSFMGTVQRPEEEK